VTTGCSIFQNTTPMENTGTLTKESFQLFNHLPEVRTKLPANVTKTDLSRIDDDLSPSNGESIARLRNQLGLTPERIERQNRIWTHLEEGELDALCVQLSPGVLLAPPPTSYEPSSQEHTAPTPPPSPSSSPSPPLHPSEEPTPLGETGITRIARNQTEASHHTTRRSPSR